MSGDRQPYQILVIDDDPTTRLLLRKTLKALGYEVAVASHGREGIAIATAEKPALIICDWMMPEVDGLEVCRQIKQDQELSRSFFVLLTAKGEVEDRIQGLDAGADEFLSKPIDPNELRARIQAGLRLYQLNQDLLKQKQLLEAELHEAADYVRSLLPAPQEAPCKINYYFLPSSQLGGDCFDFFWVGDRYLVLYILDMSGHGLGAALPSVSVLNLLRSTTRGEQTSGRFDYLHPAQVLEALNNGFQMTDQQEKYFTIWYGVYDRQRRQLTYASGGHPPALLLTPEADGWQATLLKTPGIPIGMFADMAFTQATIEVPPSTVLYLFSDGIYEFETTANRVWGLEAFRELLMAAHTQDLMPALPQLIAQVQRHAAPDAFGSDDVSLVQVAFPAA
ncbi:PP2C family protein-serine/threonine phosphatase [Thermosynechococcus sp.]|uniref:PP2C family protein-serine/threonine phosphatase n=1 Tax=Thermosynechococcus sp. TaxID=2814275 RepID=UPI00391D6E2A